MAATRQSRTLGWEESGTLKAVDGWQDVLEVRVAQVRYDLRHGASIRSRLMTQTGRCCGFIEAGGTSLWKKWPLASIMLSDAKVRGK